MRLELPGEVVLLSVGAVLEERADGPADGVRAPESATRSAASRMPLLRNAARRSAACTLARMSSMSCSVVLGPMVCSVALPMNELNSKKKAMDAMQEPRRKNGSRELLMSDHVVLTKL